MTTTLQRSPGPSPEGAAHGRGAERGVFRPDIEGLRAFAVLSVVLYHARIGHVRGGYIGVDVFFVISGFLITRLLIGSVGKGGVRALPTFYTRRIRRLLPAAMTVVVATVVAARIWAPALSVRSISIDGIFTTFYGLNYRLAVEGTQYLNQGSVPSPLQHYWSLAVEEQFYVCWPILIVLVVLLGRRYRNWLLLFLLAAVVAVSFHYSVSITRGDAPWAYFSLLTRAWELALGALVAVSASQLSRMPKRVAVVGAWLGLIAIVASAFIFSDSTPYPGSEAALPVVGAAVVIACGCRTQRGAGGLLGTRPLQYVGKLSYSWYLWHWPMLILAAMVIGHALTLPQRVMVVLASLLAAAVTYVAIENPARSFNMPNVKWFAGGALLSGTAVIAAFLVLGNLPSTVGKGAATSVVHASVATSQVTVQMKQAVAAGLDTIEAPRNLVPEPAYAHGDVPSSSDNGCHADYFAISQGPCVYGDPSGSRTVVLFGDSHMQQWQPGFVAAGQYAHWRVVNWTKSACPVAELTVVAAALNRVYTECNTWRALTLRRIATLKPDVVVVTSSEDLAAASVTPAEYANAMTATLRTLEQTTRAQIVYFEDTPYPGYNMAECVASHLGDVRSCDFSTARAYTDPARHLATLQAVEKLGGVRIVDPKDWICAGNMCPAVVGNLLVYRDQSHISVEFSRWLTPMITSLLAAEVSGHTR
jgi:peptidoglycan/LPS O-acetylase OafA/YrhL